MRVSLLAGFLCMLGAAVLWPNVAQATHVRAGEITTRRLPGSSLTYEITLTTYYDELKGAPAAADARFASFCYGDGTPVEEVPRLLPIRRLSPTTSVNIYRVIHTFAAPSTTRGYVISAFIQNRNNDTRNYNGGVDTQKFPFFVTTTIQVNTALGFNSTPVLLNPPVDSARVGQRYCHNPAAFDPDGDSLAFRFVQDITSPLATIPLTSEPNGNSRCVGFQVTRYVSPTSIGNNQNEATTGPASFTINSQTGDLCWDAPGAAGQYNIAFVVEEWRNGVLIGEITRDMQIIVTDSPNRRPLLQVPPDLCVEAGQNINFTVTGTDPDATQRVILSAYGGPFNLTPDNILYNPPIIAAPFAQFTPNNVAQAQPATGRFTWQTNCNHIRLEAYDVVFKAADVPPRTVPGLTALQSVRIRVVGPRPQGLSLRPAVTVAGGRGFQLNWTPYTCVPTTPGSNGTVTQIVIYRKEGCTDFPPSACQTGLPASLGYTEIGRVPFTTSTFNDTTSLRRGVSYSYRIVALYPLPTGGFSVASNEACQQLPLLAPLLTNVTVDSTAARGQITVRWTRPIGLRPTDFGGPYQYRLFRATGLGGTSFTQVASINTTLQPNVADTVFVDRVTTAEGLNTVANAYTYRLEFYYTNAAGQLTRLDVTDPASSVRLSATGAVRQVQLRWEANTPWSNDRQRHRVYRSRRGPAGPFNIVAEVDVTGQPYTFTDTGTDTFASDGNTTGALSADSSYCYRVETVGRYTDGPGVALGLLRNFSQIVCAQPSDTTRPCPPQLTVDTLNCATLSDQAGCNASAQANTLRWTYPARDAQNNACDPNIVRYNIYYARCEGSPLTKIDSVAAPITTFRHQNLTAVSGCYVVTAVNRRGLESRPSNRVCKEDCPFFKLPNVFTPNNDGKNDFFEPFDCPRAVESVRLEVFNRWGAKIFESEGPTMRWDGNATGGNPLPGGTYYYVATVRFSSLNCAGTTQTFKNWVQLIRNGTTSGQ